MPPKPMPPELVALRQHNTLALWVRWRLRELAAGRTGEDREFATLLEIAGSQWSRIKSGTPVGTRLARRIEAACGQPEGWLDQPHDAAAEAGAAPAPTLPEGWGATPPPVDLNAELVPHPQATLLLHMVGDAMRDAGILDGHLLLVDQSLSAVHGDIVAAELDDGFSIRRLYRQDACVKLLPAHPDFPELVLQEGQEARIRGVVTATIRRLR